MNERSIWLRGMRKYFLLCSEKEEDIWAEGMDGSEGKSTHSAEMRPWLEIPSIPVGPA